MVQGFLDEVAGIFVRRTIEGEGGRSLDVSYINDDGAEQLFLCFKHEDTKVCRNFVSDEEGAKVVYQTGVRRGDRWRTVGVKELAVPKEVANKILEEARQVLASKRLLEEFADKVARKVDEYVKDAPMEKPEPVRSILKRVLGIDIELGEDYDEEEEEWDEVVGEPEPACLLSALLSSFILF